MRERTAGEAALLFEEARQIVISAVGAFAGRRALETVALADAHGRVLAETLHADRDYPALRRSLRDGFAVRSADVPGTLRIRGEVRAGEGPQPRIEPGEALEIMTGAPVPDGADAVIMVEHVTRAGGEVQIAQKAEPGQFVNRRAAEAAQGSILIDAGTILDASHIATLAIAGHVRVPVTRAPSIAILATGDEIVALEETPAPHQVRNSNSYMLAALVRAAGGRTTILPVARDTKEALAALLEKGLQHEMLLVTGGVSAGKYDLVKPGLRELGVRFHFERVRVQPG